MKRLFLSRKVLFFIFAMFAIPAIAPAQLILSGTNYTQNFDAIGSGLPTGWFVRTNAGATSLGIDARYTSSGATWSTSTGQFSNQASTTNNDSTAFTGSESATTQAAATNRCLAIRQTGAFGDPSAAFILQIQDTMGFANFQLGLDFNLLSPQGRTTVWTLDYGLGATPSSFTVLGSYTAYSTNSGIFGTTHKSFSFGSALDNQNQNVWIRIIALAASTGSGSRDTFGIDNFILGYTPYVATSNPPSITAQPSGATHNAGETATFSVTAIGPLPLNYHWRRNTSDLSDGGNISGAFSTVLTVSNVVAADAGSYTVQVSNNYGSTNSSGAMLTVIDPIIITQPVGRTNVAGDTGNFFVTVAGTAPITYQWKANGTNLPGATATSLNVTNVQAASQGTYWVAITNSQGVLTSSNVSLTFFGTPTVRLARWNFNATNSLAADAPIASSGTGAASLVGGTTAAFTSGSYSDPAALPGSANSGWNSSGYASQGSSNKLTGVQFNTSTAGYQGIVLTWEQRHSNTASKYARLQYSADGTNFSDGPVLVMTATNNDFEFYSADLSGIATLNNNSNFAFRIVSEFESTAIGTANNSYDGTVGSYSTFGTIRFDLVSVFGYPLGTVTPIPLAFLHTGTNLILTWVNSSFALQSAPAPTGLFTNVPIASSPYTNPITRSPKYFRLIK